MRNRFKKGDGGGIAENCWRREIGLSQPINFTRRVSASEDVVKRINLYGKLRGHQGCVNTVEFNSTGEVLVTGSDDTNVIFWDWERKRKKLLYSSGHTGNIFQARIMPFTDDRKIVTSSADGQVRLGQILENGQVTTRSLGAHEGCAYRIAVEPGSPHILYSCGDDGFVQHFDLRSDSATKLFSCSSLEKDHHQHSDNISLKSIAIDPRNPNYFTVGGSDQYARIYDRRNSQRDAASHVDMPVNVFCPRHLVRNANVNITGLAYSNTSELLVSYNDELIYLFQKNMGLGPSPLQVSVEDLQKLEEPQVYEGHRNFRTIKGVNFFGPNCDYVISGSDCGHIFIWKKKSAKLVRVMVGDRLIVNQMEPHPHMSVLASCGIDKTVKLWDTMPKEVAPLSNKEMEKILEVNKLGREGLQSILSPEAIVHVLRLLGQGPLSIIRRRSRRDESRGTVEEYEDEDFVT